MGMEADQVQKFNERAKEFSKEHPDFASVVDRAKQRAAEQGLDISVDAADEVVRLGQPEIIYYLASDEGNKELREISGQKGQRSRDTVRRIGSRLRRNDTFKTVTEKPDEVQTYLEKRRQDFRSGKRRR